MKTYKLIKEYPGSPRLNTEIIESTIYGASSVSVIKSFMIKGEEEFRLSNPKNYPEFWEEVVEKDKVKQPLFKTEDGVDIFKGDEYFYTTDLFVCVKSKAEKYSTTGIASTGIWKDFSTKEKAEEYILMNKPCLSLNEVWDIFDVKLPHNARRRNKIKELVEAKIK